MPADNLPAQGSRDDASGGKGGGHLLEGLKATNWSLVILLIFAGIILVAIFQDSRVLWRLQDPGYARGVITFLISLAAIGLAFMFVYQAFTDNKTSEEGFQRGREVLSGLMGVLGTIVGFYFGSAEKSSTHLELAARHEGTNLIVHAVGGTPPYRGSVVFEPKDVPGVESLQSKDGWIVVSLAKSAKATKAIVEVDDAKDINASTTVDLKAPAGSSAPEAGKKEQPSEAAASGEPAAPAVPATGQPKQ